MRNKFLSGSAIGSTLILNGDVEANQRALAGARYAQAHPFGGQITTLGVAGGIGRDHVVWIDDLSEDAPLDPAKLMQWFETEIGPRGSSVQANITRGAALGTSDPAMRADITLVEEAME